MPNQLSGQTGASPREYNSHQRHSNLARRRHDAGDGQLFAFLTLIATALSTTTAIAFAKVTKYGAATVKAATSLSQLP